MVSGTFDAAVGEVVGDVAAAVESERRFRACDIVVAPLFVD